MKKYIKLEYHHYDDEDYCDDVVTFEVPRDWLMREFDLDKKSLAKFLDEYCGEDSKSIYEQAIMDDVLINEVHFS